MRASAVAHEGDQGCPRSLDGGDLEAGQHGELRPGVERTRHHGQPADVGQGEAGEPVVVGLHRQAVAGRSRRRRDGIVGQDHAFRSAGRAARGHDERIARLDLVAHSHRRTQLALRIAGQSLVDGEGGIAGIPDSLQLVDEAGTSRQVDRNEPVHAVIGSIGVNVPTSDSISAAIVRHRRSV